MAATIKKKKAEKVVSRFDAEHRVIYITKAICDQCKQKLERNAYFLDVDCRVLCKNCVAAGYGGDHNIFHWGIVEVTKKV